MNVLFFRLLFLGLGWHFYNSLNPFCYILRHNIIFGFSYVLFSLGILIYESPQPFNDLSRQIKTQKNTKPKIYKINMSLLSKQYILRFHITVENVIFVEKLDCDDELADYVERLFVSEVFSFLDDGFQGAEWQVFHGEVEVVLGLECVGQGDDEWAFIVTFF